MINEEGIESLVVQGGVEGRGIRGRPPTRWIDQMVQNTDNPFHKLVKETQDKEK